METMLGKLVKLIVTVPAEWLATLVDLSEKLTGDDGVRWMTELRSFLRKQQTWIAHVTIPNNVSVAPSRPVAVEPAKIELLLEEVGIVSVSATNEDFVAIDKFKLKVDGGICSYIGVNFNNWFLKGAGKIEKSIPAGTLHYHKLLKASTDKPKKPGRPAIIPELGGEVKAETTLTELYVQMAKQANGEECVLLTNGKWNIFYIRDLAGVVRAVFVVWSGDGWLVDASSIEDPFGWGAGVQVFSRNSVLESSEPSAPAQA